MIVCNAGPLIALARIGKLDLLKRYFGSICIPREVYEEICVRGKGKPGWEEVQTANWITTVEVKTEFAVKLLMMELNRGEAELIVLAKELNAEVVLADERIPREVLEILGFKTVGTVGVLVKAAKDGLLNLREALGELRKRGFWLADDVYERAIKIAEQSDCFCKLTEGANHRD